jgi:CheY-like chemotaxis protein
MTPSPAGALPAGRQASAKQPASQAPGSPLLDCVLIVEDHPDGRETLRLLLKLFGFHVEVAADGLEGVQKGLALHPAAAVVDIGLPEMDGYEVARRLRQALGPGLRLIAHTAYASPDSRERARQAGFDALLSKPADIDELLRLLRR